MTADPQCRVVARALTIAVALITATGSASDTPLDDDIDTFVRGRRSTFDAASHPKSDGFPMTLDLPDEWTASEAGPASFVQVFRRPDDPYRPTIILAIEPRSSIWGRLTDRDSVASALDSPAFTSSVLDSLPGAILVSRRMTEWMNRPAIRLEFELEVRSALTTAIRRTVFLCTFVDDYKVSLFGETSAFVANEESSRVRDQFLILFDLVANSAQIDMGLDATRSVGLTTGSEASAGGLGDGAVLLVSAVALGGITGAVWLLRRRTTRGAAPATAGVGEPASLPLPPRRSDLDIAYPIASAESIGHVPPPDSSLPTVGFPDNRSSPPDRRSDPEDAPASRKSDAPRGIGGWLILPAIGAILNPLFFIAASGGAFVFASDLQRKGYEEIANALRIMGLGYFALAAAFIVFAVLFFSKHRLAPRLFITLAILTLATEFVFAVWISSFFGNQPAMQRQIWSEAMRALIRGVVVAAIWIPYFLVSKRVKNTFR